MLPLPVLAAFYAAEATAAGQPTTEVAASGQIGRILARWRLELFREPGLLSAIEFHAGRAAAAKTEQKLVALVVKEVLEPLAYFNRGIKQALLGDHEEAQKEFAEAARRIQDPEGRHRLQEAMGKLLGWQPAL